MEGDWPRTPDGLTPEALVAVTEHPAFQQAMRASAAGAVSHYADNARMRRYTRDRGSYLISLAALYLHFSPDGLTATRLKSLCVTIGICSQGRVASVLAYMRGRGDLIAVTDSGDKRVRLLIPGEAFLAFQRTRFRVEFNALALLSPAGGAVLAAFDHDDLFHAYLRVSAPLMLANFGTGTDEYTQILNVFAEHDVGLLLLFELLEDREALTCSPFRISVSRVAGRLGVSRIHILKLLSEGTRTGLLEWRRDSREVAFNPRLAAALNYYFALLFMFLGYHVAMAFAAPGGRQAAA